MSAAVKKSRASERDVARRFVAPPNKFICLCRMTQSDEIRRWVTARDKTCRSRIA